MSDSQLGESAGETTIAAASPTAAAEPAQADLQVLWAYRLLLGREPEADAVSANPLKNDRRSLVRSFLSSEEFRADVEPPQRRSIARALDEGFDEGAFLRGYQALDRAGRERALAILSQVAGIDLAPPWERATPRSVTQSDVEALFRLILGRSPSGPMEWNGHQNEIGRDLDEVCLRYLTSVEFEARALAEPPAPAAIDIAAHDGFSLYAARDDAATGAHILAGSYEPHVTAAIRRCLRPAMAVVDVGANVGFFTMLAASIVGPKGSVTAVEPNPDNAKLIEASRRLNGFGHVRIACVAAAQELGLLSLVTDWSNGAAVGLGSDARLWSSRLVPCLPLRLILPRERRVDLVKIDVEGAEFSALSGCDEILRRDRPIIISEFSPDALRGVSHVEGETYLDFLLGFGMELSVIEPDGALKPLGRDAKGVIAAWTAAQTDHIDILAAPGAP